MLVGKPLGTSSEVRPGRRGDYRSRELGLGSDSKSDAAGFDSLAACSRGSGPADGERGEAAQDQRVQVPGTTPLAATRGSGRRSHKPCGVRFKSARCDEDDLASKKPLKSSRGVAKWYRVCFGSRRSLVRSQSPRRSFPDVTGRRYKGTCDRDEVFADGGRLIWG